MSITGIEHAATGIGKQAWKVKRKKIMEDIAMKYQPKKTIDKAEKQMQKAKYKEPQRGDYPKGKVGDIKYKVAYRKYLEKIT